MHEKSADKQSPRLILASQSPRRADLLRSLGLEFVVLPALVDEWEAADADPEALVLHNAELKAQTVARQQPQDWVLAADTTVALDGEVLNKPVDMLEACSMIKKLSGRTHTVFTGVCLRHNQGAVRALSACICSSVTFKELDEPCIAEYFKLVNPLDKAGAYGIQEGRELIIEGFTGSLSNIMGLPVEQVVAWLDQLQLREVFSHA